MTPDGCLLQDLSHGDRVTNAELLTVAMRLLSGIQLLLILEPVARWGVAG